MLSNIRKRKAEGGFTIIEVLIVLAIAGLIMLVVFLAVPALQRNARNTQRREDAGNILSAVSEYVANNNGSIPAAQATLGSGNNATLGSGSGVNTVPINLGYYDAADVSVKVYAAGLTTTVDSITVVTKALCNGNSVTNTGASSRSVAIIYTLENNTSQCRAS
jgi:prepilin-type N-terminal cleavage/methylation domain-containing protein